ncbi:MAG: cell division protein FtsQ [Paludibacteraceae bacterium]|nr:cell division protein FtsQ [Paludibacteraceae bacterium]
MKISKIALAFTITGILLVTGYIGFAIWSFSSIDRTIICRNLEINLLDKEKIQLISQTEIAELLAGKDLNPIGKAYKRIRTESIENELLRNPMIKSVECFKTPSGIVHLIVQQRIPRFIISGTSNFYVDAEKKIFPVSLNHAVYVPVVSGRVTKSFATEELFDFVNYVASDQFWDAQIDQIYVRNDQKIELTTRVGDAVIVLGSLDNYAEKLDNLFYLYQKGFNKMGWNLYKSIDLQYKNQIVCKRKSKQDFELPPLINQQNDSTALKVL